MHTMLGITSVVIPLQKEGKREAHNGANSEIQQAYVDESLGQLAENHSFSPGILAPISGLLVSPSESPFLFHKKIVSLQLSYPLSLLPAFNRIGVQKPLFIL